MQQPEEERAASWGGGDGGSSGVDSADDAAFAALRIDRVELEGVRCRSWAWKQQH